MDIVIDSLRTFEFLVILWRAIILSSIAFLIGLGLYGIFASAGALRFLSGFGSNVFANSLEAVLRAFAGVAFIGASPENRFPEAAFWFGLVLLVTAVGILFLPKGHKKYGNWSMRILTPIAPFYGALSAVFGVAILYSFYWGAFG